MAPMDKVTGVSLPCLMSDHDRWKSQSTTVSATDETWQILPADVKAAVKAAGKATVKAAVNQK